MPLPKKQTPVRADTETLPVASDSESERGSDKAGPNIKGLRKFARKSDRQDPPTFAGRCGLIKKFIEDLQDRSEDWIEGKSDAWKGATWLFQGAPGAGKTALLSHLKKLMINGEPVRLCLPEKTALNDPNQLKKEIAGAFSLSGFLKKDWLKRMEAGKNAGGNLNVGIPSMAQIGGGLSGSSGKAPMSAWRDLVKDAQNKPEKYPPVLLMVDEAQTIDDEAKHPLLWLHEGTHGLPIIPMFGGLAWTEGQFYDLGISRTSLRRVHTLEALSEAECREVAQAFFDTYRVVGSEQEQEEWAKMIARECRGWPQHLHAGLQGLAETLAEAGGVLEEADRPTALKGGADRRQEYYEARISSFESGFHEVRFLAAASVAYMDRDRSGQLDSVLLGSAIDRGHVRRLALDWPKMNLEEDDPRLMLPEGAVGKDLVRAMLRAGIFHKGINGLLHVPIPSFTDYLCSKLDWLAARSGESPQPDPPEPGM